MKNTFLILITLLYITVSCQSPDQKDHSFTLEEYKERGFPDLNQSWGISEQEMLFEQLSKIKYQHPLSLPRKDSRKSGPLFKRIISKDNLAFLDADTIPLQMKVFTIRVYGDFVDDLIKIYWDIFQREQYYNTELVDLYILKITVAREMLNLAKKILGSEHKNDQALVADLESIQHNIPQ